MSVPPPWSPARHGPVGQAGVPGAARRDLRRDGRRDPAPGPRAEPSLDAARAVWDHVGDAVLLVATDTSLVDLNPAARRWLGLGEADVAGRPLHALGDVSPVCAHNRSLLAGMPYILREVVETGSPFAEDEMTVYDADGRLVTASTRLDPVPGPGPEPLVVWTVRLLDEDRAIFRASSVAMARVSPVGTFLQANSALERMLGRDEESLVGTAVVDVVLPEDRAAWRSGSAAALLGDAAGAETEQRLVAADGGEVWTRATQSLLRGSHRVDAVLLVVVQDVGAHRRAEAEAARTAADQRLLAELAATALGAPDAGALLRDTADLLVRRDGALAVEWTVPGRRPQPSPAEQQRAGDRPGTWLEAPLAVGGARGRLRVLVPAAEAAADDRRTLVAAVADLLSTGLARLGAQAALREQSMRDPLTGLANRGLLIDRLGEALAAGQGAQHPVGVLFVDLDGFKAVNDAHGHEAGDQLLVHFAARLRGLVRAHDMVCRWGGDEFVVLCRRMGGRLDALALARRVADAAAQPFALTPATVVVGASVGVSVSHAGSTVDGMIHEADQSMYRAKRDQAPGQPAAGPPP